MDIFPKNKVVFCSSALKDYARCFLACLIGLILLGCSGRTRPNQASRDLSKQTDQLLSVRLQNAAGTISKILTSEDCAKCHGAQAFSPTQVFRYLDLSETLSKKMKKKPVPTKNSKLYQPIAAKDFRLFRILAGKEELKMPLLQEEQWKTPNAKLLAMLPSGNPTEIKTYLKRQKIPSSVLPNSLGSQIVYQNQRGVCFDKTIAGHNKLKGDLSLCEAFHELASAATDWMKIGGKPAYWPKLQDLFVKGQSLDKRKQKTSPKVSKSTPTSESYEAGRMLHRLPDGATMSFYLRVSPEEDIIGMRGAGVGQPSNPYLLDVASKTRIATLQNTSYDPTFSPDFSRSKRTGFLIAQRGVLNNTFSKKVHFFAPNTYGQNMKMIHFKDISGYPSIAKISALKEIATNWKPFADKYIIMGKRWRWAAFDTIRDTQGRTIGIKQIYPALGKTASPICNGKVNRNLNHSDALLSADGRWISTKRSYDQAIMIINTATCQTHTVLGKNGKTMSGSKAMFSDDGNYVTFHSYGPDGYGPRLSFFANSHRLKTLAQQGQIANIFVMDLRSKQIRQVSFHDKSKNNEYFAVFPSLSSHAKWIYYHRHSRYKAYSEIMKIRNPLFEENSFVLQDHSTQSPGG